MSLKGGYDPLSARDRAILSCGVEGLKRGEKKAEKRLRMCVDKGIISSEEYDVESLHHV